MSQKSKTKNRGSYYVQGYVVAIALTILTAIEYFVAVTPWLTSTILLFILAIMKGALVVNYFMHVSNLWSPEEEH